jgi:hypothetical protein
MEPLVAGFQSLGTAFSCISTDKLSSKLVIAALNRFSLFLVLEDMHTINFFVTTFKFVTGQSTQTVR